MSDPPTAASIGPPRPSAGLFARRFFCTAAALSVLLALAACGENETPGAPSEITGTSHNPGRNCVECHGFTAAGTVYAADGMTTVAGAVVRLSTGPGGNGVVATLTSDATGNFYTTRTLGFAAGLYADVARAGGSPQPMPAPVTSGGCNASGCHAAGNRIRVN